MADIKQIKIGSTTYNVEPYISRLKLDGTSTMTGKLNLLASGNNDSNIGSNGIRGNSDSLPEDTAPAYVNTIDAFAYGGRQKWCYLSTLKTCLGVPTINSSTFNDVGNISYQNGTTPNVEYVKDGSGNYLGVKPYALTVDAGTASVGFKGTNLIQSTDNVVGEWGTIDVKSSSSYSSSKSGRYILYYGLTTIPVGIATTQFYVTSEDGGNYCLYYKPTNSPVFFLKGRSVKDFSPTWYKNELVVSWTQADSKGTTRICFTLAKRPYTNSTSVTGGSCFLHDLAGDGDRTAPNRDYYGDCNYIGGTKDEADYYCEADYSEVTISRTINHKIVLGAFSAPTLNRTSSLVTTANVTHGGIVYKDDVLKNPNTGKTLTVANGYNNDFTFSDVKSFAGTSITFNSASDGYITGNTPLNSPVVTYGTLKTYYYSSGSSTSLTNTAKLGIKQSYSMSSGNTISDRCGAVGKYSRIYGEFQVGETKAPFDVTQYNPNFPTSISYEPSISGEIRNEVLNGNATSYVNYVDVSVYNPNSHAVSATIDLWSDGGGGYSVTTSINAKSTYSFSRQYSHQSSEAEVDVVFQSYGLTKSSYAHFEGSTS